MRALNCNITPGFTPAMASVLAWSPPGGILLPVALRFDPANPARCQIIFADDETATGGSTLTVWATGAAPFSAPATIPPLVGNYEGPSIELKAGIPPFPSRADALAVKLPFQGCYVTSKAFSASYQAVYGGNGQIPFYAAALQDFWAAGDGIEVLDQLSDWSHVMLYCRPGGPGYNEDGQPYGNDQIIPAFDCWGNMAVYKGIADTTISRGQKPAYILWGEGQEGFDWIKANAASWIAQMREGYDRLRYGPVIIGFDGVWPEGWSVEMVKDMIPWLRAQLGPDAYLGMFFANGPGESGPYLWVEKDTDYVQPWMDGLDLVFTSTGPGAVDCPSLANKAGYMVPSPDFSGCQPDQGTHFIFVPNSRGARVWMLGEWATYQTVRDPQQTWKQPVAEARARMAALGCQAWG